MSETIVLGGGCTYGLFRTCPLRLQSRHPADSGGGYWLEFCVKIYNMNKLK